MGTLSAVRCAKTAELIEMQFGMLSHGVVDSPSGRCTFGVSRRLKSLVKHRILEAVLKCAKNGWIDLNDVNDLYVMMCFYTRSCLLGVPIIMAALCNMAGYYIFCPVISIFPSSSSSSSIFFPRLISAVGDWMSTILPHI